MHCARGHWMKLSASRNLPASCCTFPSGAAFRATVRRTPPGRTASCCRLSAPIAAGWNRTATARSAKCCTGTPFLPGTNAIRANTFPPSGGKRWRRRSSGSLRRSAALAGLGPAMNWRRRIFPFCCVSAPLMKAPAATVPTAAAGKTRSAPAPWKPSPGLCAPAKNATALSSSAFYKRSTTFVLCRTARPAP